MKNSLLSGVVVLGLCILILFFYHQFYSPKIAFVDSNRLLSEYNGTQSAVQAFEERSKVLRANLDTLALEFQQSLKQFEKDRTSMTEKEIQLNQELLRNKQSQLNQYQQTTEQKIQEEDQKMSNELYTKINSVIKDYGEKKNFKFILGAKGDGSVLHAEQSLDITDELIQVLNETN